MAASSTPESDVKFAGRFELSLPLAPHERPVQDFGCTLQRSDWKMPHAGTLYITRMGLFFYVANRLVGGTAHVSFADVTAVEATSNLLMLPAIRVETYTGTLFFSNFIHRANCLAIIQHMVAATLTPLTFLHRKLVRGSDVASGMMTGGAALRGRLLGRGQDEDVLFKQLKTSRALQLAYETLDIGTSTLTELDHQGELIARQRVAMAHIHANMDEADRLLRGMSLTGAAANAFTSRPTSVEDADAAASASINTRG
ncbi:uncharacterized protein AMSG_03239 [Thecamonas trahens ATCC 50062]|uniref:GRAM domain-containing protein n=1 Tax=Thecamonas trahens ATCC 50062 TaxID=461836 RepID=A0A0L0D666_THETB|nr:hypothetical protein AMSG_03239 [Thecamonas trahens ATCC 50062]KNC46808.1 hypothetical protein AMSG_03239 [Thecamonas trahens ATCC 50062]|eukprot:XP_013760083.1 hypothetical protein AMSG_03239 [Thecamonas trahens ATCC 50062]